MMASVSDRERPRDSWPMCSEVVLDHPPHIPGDSFCRAREANGLPGDPTEHLRLSYPYRPAYIIRVTPDRTDKSCKNSASHVSSDVESRGFDFVD
eukprot:754994-Hanusia_phi.AAC.1